MLALAFSLGAVTGGLAIFLWHGHRIRRPGTQDANAVAGDEDPSKTCNEEGGKVAETSAFRTVFIWSHPRSLSTVLMRSLAELPSIATVVEPFMYPFQVDVGAYHGVEENPPTYEQALHALKSGQLLSAPASSSSSHRLLQVVKDMPCHGGLKTLDMVLSSLPGAKHVILFRHPHRAVKSYLHIADYPVELMRADISYSGLVEYAERLTSQLGSDNVLFVYSDELIRDPPSALKSICQYLGVQYGSNMLSWEPGAPESWGDCETVYEGWFEGVLKSTGWQRQPDLDLDPVLRDDVDGLEREFILENMSPFQTLLGFHLRQRPLLSGLLDVVPVNWLSAENEVRLAEKDSGQLPGFGRLVKEPCLAYDDSHPVPDITPPAMALAKERHFAEPDDEVVKTSEARAAATAEAKAFLFGERLASLVSLKAEMSQRFQELAATMAWQGRSVLRFSIASPWSGATRMQGLIQEKAELAADYLKSLGREGSSAYHSTVYPLIIKR
ncbi:Branched-chain-amino-acid aminotransferase-like protein 2 [Symbiodinium microadriaticum]|uniref:Branched-chain-amino-acid aminotransferase-like protein 2 n=1 Tax=Symbiodinium microadriaticum TaxID=2951 RepID=A0A1Q9DA11_SYMMI|nr:Branched-chain-amino-acid aminotransferase-like protein 2 [Symbiodinium microadriaticum]